LLHKDSIIVRQCRSFAAVQDQLVVDPDEGAGVEGAELALPLSPLPAGFASGLVSVLVSGGAESEDALLFEE
jgi:hypothetical protein